MLGDDVGEVGVDGPPKLELLCEDASEVDDGVASRIVSIEPEVGRDRSDEEGASGRD